MILENIKSNLDRFNSDLSVFAEVPGFEGIKSRVNRDAETLLKTSELELAKFSAGESEGWELTAEYQTTLKGFSFNFPSSVCFAAAKVSGYSGDCSRWMDDDDFAADLADFELAVSKS